MSLIAGSISERFLRSPASTSSVLPRKNWRKTPHGYVFQEYVCPDVAVDWFFMDPCKDFGEHAAVAVVDKRSVEHFQEFGILVGYGKVVGLYGAAVVRGCFSMHEIVRSSLSRSNSMRTLKYFCLRSLFVGLGNLVFNPFVLLAQSILKAYAWFPTEDFFGF